MKNRNISKFLSLVLRHQPEILGVKLDKYGWASTQEIIEKMSRRGMKIDLPTIQRVVQDNDKQRFKLTDDSTMIRANQGHSIDIVLGYKPQQPPIVLYHGTARKNLDSIFSHGLIRGNRHHVHLSTDKATAVKVGQRHGLPTVLIILAAKMDDMGMEFYCSDNGVWLTDYVAPEFIKPLN